MNTEKKGVAPASPFSYATKQPGGDKTHRPPDTAARLRPTKQPVCFTTEQPSGDTLPYPFATTYKKHIRNNGIPKSFGNIKVPTERSCF